MGFWRKREQRTRSSLKRTVQRQRLLLEELEPRRLLSVSGGTWTPLTNVPSGEGTGTMLLLSNGTVMAQAPDTTDVWYQLTPDASGSYINGTISQLASMNLQRKDYTSDVLPNGNVIVVGGEESGPSGAKNFTNTGEIYNPQANTWTSITPFPQSEFGDDPSEVLPNGTVLAGYINGAKTYIYNPATDSWSPTGAKLAKDQSDEETWVKLPDNSILSYSIFSSISSGTATAQRYVPSTGSWVSAGTLPDLLSTKAVGYELGPGFLLPDGRVFQLGGNSNTALYTPSTNTWVAGPTVPNGWAADDASGAELPNGHVIFAVDTPVFNAPTELFDFDPTTNTITQLTSLPSQLNTDLTSIGSGVTRMLILPTGQLLLSTKFSMWVFTPTDSPIAASAPTISSISLNGDGTYTLTGTQLNGVSEGANYGDDAEMAENYPIVQLTAANGDVYYARTYNWSSTGVATGNTPVTTQFALPAGLPNGQYSLAVIADGITSAPVSFSQPAPEVQSVTIDNGTPQRSEVRSITVDFGGTIVSAPSSAFSVSRVGDHLSIPVTASALTQLPDGNTQVVLTFSGPNLDGSSVPNGYYMLSIDGSQIFDNYGQQLDAARTGVASSMGTIVFFRLFGDANGDGIVNSQDIAIVSSNWLGQGPNGDLNGDGIVNGQDLAAIASTWLNTLPAVAGPIAISTPTSVQSVAVNGAIGVSSIAIADPSLPTNVNVNLTLTVADGSATLLTSTAGGITSTEITGNGTGNVTITAPLSAINTTLAASGGLTYAPISGFNGTDTLALSAADPFGNSKATNVSITVAGPLAITTSGGQSVAGGGTLLVSGISLADPSLPTSDNVTLTVSATSGTATLSTSVAGGITSSQVTGNGSGSLTITAPLAAINTTLANPNGLTYAPNSGFNGMDALVLSADDPLGNSSTSSVSITITLPPAALLSSVAASFSSPPGVDHVAAFIGPPSPAAAAATIDPVLPQGAGAQGQALGQRIRSGIASLVNSSAAADETETVAEQWASTIDDDLLATLAAGRRL